MTSAVWADEFLDQNWECHFFFSVGYVMRGATDALCEAIRTLLKLSLVEWE